MTPLPERLVVAGTDTDVGKTVVSALLVRGLKATYWKPVQCGDIAVGGDSARVAQLAGLTPGEVASRILPEAYRLAAPASPNQAAAAEGLVVQEQRLHLPAVAGPLVVECAGGLLVPLRDDLLQITMISHWQLPVVLVARSGLGTLNHTLLSLEALERRGIPLVGAGAERRTPRRQPGQPRAHRPGAGAARVAALARPRPYRPGCRLDALQRPGLLCMMPPSAKMLVAVM
jgi:dethiobiotin synthetase